MEGSPQNLLEEVVRITPSRYMVFPCDIVELRGILSNMEIKYYPPIPLFSLFFSEKYLRDYPVFLCLDKKDVALESYDYGGITLIDCKSIDIRDRLIRIIINEDEGSQAFQVVKRIIEDLGVETECLISNKISPFTIDKGKEAKVNDKGNWFRQIMAYSETQRAEESFTQRDPEVKKGPGIATPKYYEGMRIRDRRAGMVNPREYGRVDSIKGNKMKIVWNPDNKDKRKEEIFDMVEDSASLSLIVAEV